MILTVKKILNLRAKIRIQSSKSQGIRRLLFSLLAYGESILLGITRIIAQETTMITVGGVINKTYLKCVEITQNKAKNLSVVKNISNKHIILIGFKNVGKTRIGKQLAKMLNKKFIDLDKEVEKVYGKKYLKLFTYRQIMQSHGESHYRALESEVLQQVLKLPSCVIALGGATSLDQINQVLINAHILLHVVAARGIVFERIMVEGRPAFFDANEDPYESFNRLWDERHVVYKKLTTRVVDNSRTVEQAVNQAANIVMAYLPKNESDKQDTVE